MKSVINCVAVVLVGFVALAARPAPARLLTHTYGSGASAIVVTLVDISPNGPVRILGSPPGAYVRHPVSHAQFEQMWTTLLANGAAKLERGDPLKVVDGVHNYVFSLADVPTDQGSKLIRPKTLQIPVSGAPPAVAEVARQLRAVLSK